MEPLEKDEELVFSLEYAISLPEYQQFSLAVANEYFAKRRKKNAITSAVELTLAVLICIWVFTSGQNSQIAIILSVALLGLAVYSFGFYRIIFPRTVLKNAAENYQKSAYLQNTVSLSFFKNRVEEVSLENRSSFGWVQLTRMRETQSLYALEFGKEKTLLLPKEKLGEQGYLAAELLHAVCEKFSVKWEKAA